MFQILVFKPNILLLLLSCGVDGLSAEHCMYAGNYVKVYLSISFTSFISHGYLPDGFMKSAIIPLIKNKTGDTNDKNNYRPIALVTAMSKIFELCLSEKLNDYLLRQIINLVLKQTFDRYVHLRS